MPIPNMSDYEQIRKPVCAQIANPAGLDFLLRYAQQHSHSAAWIPAITLLLQRGGAHV